MPETMLKIPLTGGGDPDPKLVAKSLNSGGNPNLNLVETRDIIANHIAKGGVGLQDEESRADFKRLSSLLGPDKAQKLFSQLALYNQDADVKKLPYLDRVSRFYDTGHGGDADMLTLLKNVKGIGYGPVEGAVNSRYGTTQDAAGKILLRIAQK